MNIVLEGDYTVDGTRITLRTDIGTYIYKLPKGQRRVTLYTGSRPKLALGGFKSLPIVSVEGPADVLQQLLEAVL